MKIEDGRAFVRLYLTPEEVQDVLQCIEASIEGEEAERWTRLNSLRTAFSEAGYTAGLIRGNDDG